MGYQDDSNKRYAVYGPSSDPLDGILIQDGNGNIILRADKDGVEDGNGNTLVDGSGNNATDHISDTQSGDGNKTVFTVSHNFSSAPSYAQVTARSANAKGDYHVSDLTSNHVEITYGTAPSSGTDNLSWDILVKQ